MVGIVVRFGEESLKLGGLFYLPLKAAIGGREDTSYIPRSLGVTGRQPEAFQICRLHPH